MTKILSLAVASMAALVLSTANSLAQSPDGGDAIAGALVFKKCAPCHSMTPGQKKVGPNLYGVIGRTPGTLEGYKYSPAMIAFGETGAVWNAATLDSYLLAPRDVVSKTKMIFPGLPDAQARANLIAYLAANGAQ